MSRVPITKDGEISIKEKLSNLKFVERPQISQAIAEARAHGDLKENAVYHAAKELQGLVEAKISEMESALSNAQVIDCLLYTSPSPRDSFRSRMPSSA